MNPQQPQPFDPSQILNAITSLKDDLTKEMDSRFSTYDEKLNKLDTVEDTLTKAREAQAQETARRQQEQERQRQGNWQPQSWEEVVKTSEDRAYARIRQEDDKRRADEQRRAQQEADEAAQLDAELQQDIDKLRKSGYLPPVGNPYDPQDPGKFAEDELISRAAALETPNVQQVAQELSFRHQKGEYWDARTQSYRSAENILTPLAGKSAPVGDSGGNSSFSSFQGPSVKEIRELSLQELAQLPQTRGYGPIPNSSSTSLPF